MGAKRGWDSRSAFSYAINGPISCFVIVLGILLSISVLATLSISRRRRLIHKYLWTLSAWDIVLLVNALLLYSVNTIGAGNGEIVTTGPYVYTYPIWYTGSNIAFVGTLWVVLLLTMDRYFALCRPFLHRRLLSDERRGRIALCLVSLLAFAYGLPGIFELEVRTICDVPLNNQTCYAEIFPSHHRVDLWYKVIYRIMGHLLFYSVVPFLLLVVLTILISVQMRKSLKQRRKMTVTTPIYQPRNTSFRQQYSLEIERSPPVQAQSSLLGVPNDSSPTSSRSNSFSSRRHFSNVNGSNQRLHRASQHSNLMPIVLISKFVISHSFPTFLDVAELVLGEQYYESLILAYVVDISNFFVILNSATNFCIYFLWSREFRAEFYNIRKRFQTPHPSRNSAINLSTTRRNGQVRKSQSFQIVV